MASLHDVCAHACALQVMAKGCRRSELSGRQRSRTVHMDGAYMSTKEEEKYFQQIEAERHEQKRRERELEALRQQERTEIKSSLHTSEDIAQEALELGFDADTARVLPLLPLIQVAWVDGKVTSPEEKSVLELAQSRGVEPNTPAYNFLRRLLLEQPSDVFFERVTNVILHMVEEDPTSWVTQTLPDLCLAVAKASGGFFGLFDSVSDEERLLIQELAHALELASHSAQSFSGAES